MKEQDWTWDDRAKVPDYDLRDVPRELAAHIEAGCAVLTKAFARLSATVEAAETAALIDAVERQIEAWEDCESKPKLRPVVTQMTTWGVESTPDSPIEKSEG